jgi:hypothetical protein
MRIRSAFLEVRGLSSQRRNKIWSELRYVEEIARPGFVADVAVTK